MQLELAGRRVLVTGGSKGIGLAVVRELVHEGAQVATCARSSDELDRAAEAVRAEFANVRLHTASVDVTDAASYARYVQSVAQQMGGLDILVSNAGGAAPGNFETLTDAAWEADLNVKLRSQIVGFRAALPYLRQSSQARVVNINSIYAKQPNPAFFATTVIRAACLNLNKALAQEFGPDGILVNSVNIGCVDTPQWENIRRRRTPDKTTEQFRSQLHAEIPLGRFGRVEEVSGLVAFLVSDRGSYITGASIDVAGGMGTYP